MNPIPTTVAPTKPVVVAETAKTITTVDTKKSVVASQTNWGALVALLGSLLPLVGFDLGEGAGEDIQKAIGATVTAAGLLWIVVQRFTRGDLYFSRPKP